MVEMKKLTVELRDELGKRSNRRLRANGRIPAVLYGHKQKNVILSVPKEEVEAVLRHGNRFIILAGALNERAFIKECQWDTWGKVILHVDFTRVSEHEHVQLSVPLELRGEAPGLKEGGVIKQILHTLEIECEPAAAPEKIGVNVNHLEFEQSISVHDLVLPEGVRSLADPALIVVECTAPVEVSEEAQEGADGAAEPEVIGRKKAEEEEEA
ncbi:MAG: 50S ribosomal protein L25 [Planctomycetia bacterium]|nr:50S ribosomal protein L25 [Planctomycetia bacterium]